MFWLYLVRARGCMQKAAIICLILTPEKLPGDLSGRQDKEKVNLWYKCLLFTLALLFRSNNGLFLETGAYSRGKSKQKRAVREFYLCWMCGGASSGMLLSVGHRSNKTFSADRDKDLSSIECFSLAVWASKNTLKRKEAALLVKLWTWQLWCCTLLHSCRLCWKWTFSNTLRWSLLR